MRKFLDERYLESIGAQMIVEDEENKKTYVCSFDRSKYDPGMGAIEEQPCWQIKCISEAVNGSITEIRIMYPAGSKDYRFTASSAASYSYDYEI